MLLSRLRFPKTVFLFSLLFILSFIIASFHHHDDGSQHSDCPICMAGGTYTCESTHDNAGIVIHQNISYIPSFEEVFNDFCPIYPTFAYRAPPSASIV